ncbi:putative NAD(P)-binding protein [Seiridium cardinale]|uniref:NAD(P)-binding protein n=1 Tax=Seiridium cardinale TaxID=138064 RepID=A0ABR2X7V9_9PEZI
MALVKISKDDFAKLKDKIVVISGGTTGIGAAVISQLAGIGAKVVFGDINEPKSDLPDQVTFVKTDVSQYESVLNLFRTAWSIHGRIDHAISNAGVPDTYPLFANNNDDAAIEEAPPSLVLDVNLKGSIFLMRVAVHFLRKSLAAHGEAQRDASVLLVSSVTGFGNFSGLYQYSATKHGVLGLFRSSHGFLQDTEGIRVNVVLPNMTKTQMVQGIINLYESLGIPCNEPTDVADAFLYALCSAASGEGLYVSGAKTYEIEKAFRSIGANWLGKELYDEFLAGQKALSSIVTSHKDGKADNHNKEGLKD